jgi:hypothetical protein
VEVGLQTANLTALKAALRRTDLRKWAAGTRRLYEHGIEVFLDVILGLPADDEAGIAATLDFIRREDLGPYDVFTLQVLPGTAVRQQAGQYGLRFQERPPYYVVATNTFSFSDLRRLRRELKIGAGLDPDEIEGCPPPHSSALRRPTPALKRGRPLGQGTDNQYLYGEPSVATDLPIADLWLVDAEPADWEAAAQSIARLATHVDIVARWADAAQLAALLRQAIVANPTTLLDCYLLVETPPDLAMLCDWRAGLPYQPSYFDRVAVYRRAGPEPGHQRVSPRVWLIAPWTAQIDPAQYAGVAEVIWEVELADGEAPPLGAWHAAGGAGVWLRGRAADAEEAAGWAAAIDGRVWIG